MESPYKIRVKTLDDKILTFHGVKEYISRDGFIRFIDEKTGLLKVFSTSACEIESDIIKTGGG